MRKFSIILALVLVFTFAFFGCGSGDNSDVETQMPLANGDEISAPVGAPQEQGKMIIGKIKAIAGNQITLELGETENEFTPGERPTGDFEDFSMPEGMSRPEGAEPPEGFNPDNMPEGFDPSNMPDFEKGEMPEGFEFDGEMPQGGRPGGQMPGMSADDLEITYTGETAKYIIPSGLRVGNGDYTSLSKGDVVMLMLDDNNTVTSVMVFN